MKLLKPILFAGAIALTLGVGVALGQRLYKTQRGGPALAAGESSAPLALASPAGGAPVGLNFADVAEKVNHATVAIISTEFVDASRAHGRGGGFPFEFFGPGGPFGRGAPGGDGGDGDAPQREERQESGGSGFLITPDGYILTNHHVIDGASKIEVQLEDDRKFTAKLVGSDRETDLALLKIDGKDLPVLVLGDSDKARVGEWVIAVGNPLAFSHTVTVGVLSGKGRRLQGDAGLSSFLQTDAAINFGNSGGPLVNTRGEVIGINDAIIRDDGSGRNAIQGIGFAIPVNTAKQVVDELRNRGKVSRGYLGVSVGPLQDKTRDYYETKYKIRLEGGALVHKVEEGTPAAAEGVSAGDIIVEADGKPIKDSEALVKIVAGRKPGEKIRLKFYRKGELKNATVALADRAKREGAQDEPETPSSAPGESRDYEKKLGFKVEALSAETRRQLQLEGPVKGVVVTSVNPRSGAYEAGLRPGWVITEMNDEPIRSIAEFTAIANQVKAGDSLSLLIVRGDNQRVIYFDSPEAGK